MGYLFVAGFINLILYVVFKISAKRSKQAELMSVSIAPDNLLIISLVIDTWIASFKFEALVIKNFKLYQD